MLCDQPMPSVMMNGIRVRELHHVHTVSREAVLGQSVVDPNRHIPTATKMRIGSTDLLMSHLVDCEEEQSDSTQDDVRASLAFRGRGHEF